MHISIPEADLGISKRRGVQKKPVGPGQNPEGVLGHGDPEN